MSATAVRGALGFLSRLPVGTDGDAWDGFRTAPWTFPVAGYVVGALVALPIVLAALVPLPDQTVALLYPLALVVVTGITHLDGVADLGDAAVVHDAERRHAVLKDSDTGVGALVAVALVVAGLALAGLALADVPVRTAVAVVVAAEVSAKLGMAVVVCAGTAAHEGLGSALAAENGPPSLVAPVALSLPAAALAWPTPVAGIALVAGAAGALAVFGWSRRLLGGVNGDVFGAANEVARVVALHAGVIAWTLS